MSDVDEARLKPQACAGPDAAAKTRMSMQVGAAMGQANHDLSRPSAGEEAAGACRAGVTGGGAGVR